jgi:hypothetical protein
MTNALSKMIKQDKKPEISFHRTPPKKETKKDLNPEIKSILEDAFLTSQTLALAGMLLNSAEKDRPHLNNIVKDYQCDYVLLKSKGVPKEKLEMMTFNVWWQAKHCE